MLRSDHRVRSLLLRHRHIRIAHVTIFSLPKPILDNLCFDSRTKSGHWVSLAEIDHVVRLPHGYKTELLPNTFLRLRDAASGLLARALYSQPKLLLCDEVTATSIKPRRQKVLGILRPGLVQVCHPLAGGGGAVTDGSTPWKTARCRR